MLYIVAAGTGGHIFPGIALAERAKERGIPFFLIGREKAFEEGIIKESGLPFRTYPYFERKVSHLLPVLFGIMRCLALILKDKPTAIIAGGSYASLPPVVASIILRKRLFLLEQNRIPGTLIKIFAPFARYTFFAFPPAEKVKGQIKVTGNPIRKRIKEIGKIREERILVLGGSQGARRITQCFKEIAKEFPRERFLIQVRKEDAGKVEQDSPPNVDFFLFTPNIDEFLSQAKIAVGRAGGSFVSEILYLGIPAILIPYPYAAHNHQEKNALYSANCGGALMMREEEIFSQRDKLLRVLRLMVESKEKREEMREKAKKIGRDGTEEILDTCTL